MHIIFFCMKKIRFLQLMPYVCLGFHACFTPVLAQTSVYSVHFLDYQKSFPKISEMMSREEDTLAKAVCGKTAGLACPVCVYPFFQV